MKKDYLEVRRLQDLVLEAFDGLSAGEAVQMRGLVAKESLDRGFTYQREGGQIVTMSLMLVPAFFTREQSLYLRRLSYAIQRGVDAVFRAYFTDSLLRELLPLREEELVWITGSGRDAHAMSGPIWCRLDAHFHMKRSDWKETISVFEINSCAVGGIHYSPVAAAIFMDTILPFLHAKLPATRFLNRNPDARDMLYSQLSAHARAIGRHTLNIVYSEDTTLSEGITEGPYIVEHWRKKGAHAQLADPRELYVKHGELYFKDARIDVVYRNFELSDIIEMEKDGDDTSAIRFAFANNRVISSLSGDFDHKSMWEALGSGRFDRYFSPEDAALFKRHLLWTRTLRDLRTEGPLGGTIDLIPYARRNKDMLVLKPNRLYGGYGVTIGHAATQGEWEERIQAALKDTEGWVLQRFGPPEEAVFPLFEEGRLIFKNHKIVYGLSATAEGACILGRVSRHDVVNVAQQGGLMPVLISG